MNLIEKLTINNFKGIEEKIKSLQNNEFYSLAADYRENNGNVVITDSLEKLKLLAQNDKNTNYYKILLLSTILNKKMLTYKDKCGSYYADTRPCSEDCAFCPLSSSHYFGINTKQPNWKDLPNEIYHYAKNIYTAGVRHFKVVTTGAKSDPKIIPFIAEGIYNVKKDFTDIIICISEGTLDINSMILLKDAGVDIFNNNLETSRYRFSTIVKSHTYDDKIQAIKNAKSIGLKICSGGIFGIGESLKERIELFLKIRELEVDSSPFNIFVPFPNLPLTKFLQKEKYKFSKKELFYSIALYRLINPDTRLVLGAGRRENFSEKEQSFALLIGANAIATSGYLSEKGVIDTTNLDDKIFERIFKSYEESSNYIIQKNL